MMKSGSGSNGATRSAVSIDGLVVTRNGNEILHRLNLELPVGTVTGLLGPSRCGKTTLMRTLVGVQRYTGSVRVLGHAPGARPLRDRVGYMTQGASIYTDLTARQNVTYFARLAGERATSVDEALERVHLTELADRPVSTYSGGETNRVSLACALVGAPELLVLDEPTVGLDPLTREDLWVTFRELATRGTTLLVSSHVMDEATRCDSVLLMRGGHFLAHDTAGALLERTGAPNLDAAFLAIVTGDAR